jgi:hypothetical protein
MIRGTRYLIISTGCRNPYPPAFPEAESQRGVLWCRWPPTNPCHLGKPGKVPCAAMLKHHGQGYGMGQAHRHQVLNIFSRTNASE